MNNQEFKVRPEVLNINSNKPLFYPYSIFVNKCSGTCNNYVCIHMQNYVFLMLLITWMSEYLIWYQDEELMKQDT